MIIGDAANKIGNLVSLSDVTCIDYVSLKNIDIIYNDNNSAPGADPKPAPKKIRLELSVDAVDAPTYMSYIVDKFIEGWEKPWRDPSPVTIGGKRNIAGAYDGTLPFLDSAGNTAVIATVTYM